MSALARLALGCAPAGFEPLFADTGEHARAAGSLASLLVSGRLPAEAVAHLFAYELVERLLDGLARGRGRFSALLWPPSLFAALGLEGHAWPELASLLPAELALSYRLPAAGELEAERLRLGLPAFRAADYLRALERAVEAGRWPRRFLPPLGFPGEPEQRTAAAFLVRRGHVLLERRPPGAKVTPDAWDVPGGHVEPVEEAEHALVREMREELGVEVLAARLARELDVLEPPHGRAYRHALFVVSEFRGEPHAREGQHLSWFTPEEALRLPDLNPPTGWALQELVEAGELGPDQVPPDAQRSQRST